MNTTHNSHLKHFQEHRRVLTSLSEQLVTALEVLKMTALRGEAAQLKQQFSANPLKLLVVGRPGRGKSTVINALVKEKLLPAHAVPLLCKIKWGKERRAILHYRLSQDGSQKKPTEVPFAELEDYLDRDSDKGDPFEYERLELFAPLPTCEAGLEITNLAGPYDDDGDLEVKEETQQQVFSADAILFVLSCDSIPSREELLEIDRMKRAGHKALFFLCNRFDLVEPSIQAMVKQRFITRLAPLATGGERNVFFSNAKGALASCFSGDKEHLRESNLSLLEDALYVFLAYECGQERLSHFAAHLEAIVQSAMHVTSIQVQLLQTDQEELQARCVKAGRDLELLDKARQYLNTLFALVCRTLKEKVRVAAATFYLDTAGLIEGWPQAYHLQPPNSPWDVFIGNTQERQVKELTTSLSAAMQDEFEKWTQSTLSPLLQERLSKLGQGLYEYTDLFASELQQVWFKLGGKKVRSGEDSAKAWQSPIRKLIQDAPTQIAADVVQRVNFVWHPTALISRFLKQERIQELIVDGASLERIQTVVGQEYRHELQASYQQLAQVIIEVIDDELRLIQKELDDALGLELQNVRDALHPFMREQQDEHERGYSKEAGSAYLLMASEDSLFLLDSELDSLRSFLKWYRFGLSP